LNENGIIFRLIFKMGCPVFFIAKKLDTSEAEIYRCLDGKEISREAKEKLKLLWLDLINMDKFNNTPK